MEIILWFGIIIIIIVIGLILRQIKSHKLGENKLPYYKKNPLSFAELSFFKVLEQVVGNKYYIFPQVNLASLVRSNAKGRDWWYYFRKISQKSVDFVLAEKIDCRPILVIELDDSTHKDGARQERDEFCDEVFKSAELPVLHVAYRNGYSTAQIKKEIEETINPKINNDSVLTDKI